MDVFLELAPEQFQWLRQVATTLYGQRVRRAANWGGAADVLVFDDGSYLWCLPSATEFTMGTSRIHLPRFDDRAEFDAAHDRLTAAGLSPGEVNELTDSTGTTIDGVTVSRYDFASYVVSGPGFDLEVCFEPKHDWAVIAGG